VLHPAKRIYKDHIIFLLRGIWKLVQPRARALSRARYPESPWSPEALNRLFGVHLASKSRGHNSFVFSVAYF